MPKNGGDNEGDTAAPRAGQDADDQDQGGVDQTTCALDWGHDDLGPLLRLLAGRWALLILLALAESPARRRDLKESLDGVSDKVLTDTLRRLEAAGLLTRTVIYRIPVEVNYALTPLATKLLSQLTSLADWAREHGVLAPDEENQPAHASRHE